MSTKIDGKPLWTKSPSGDIIYGKDIDDYIKKNYKEKNLNEEGFIKTSEKIDSLKEDGVL